MLPTPEYTGQGTTAKTRVALVVESMKRHMTDEGWQIMAALRHAGYELAGYNITTVGLRRELTDIHEIIRWANPSIVVVQDKREWDTKPGDFREPLAKFTHIEELARHPDIFKVTILKDAHQRQDYHEESAREMGCHAWIVYYNPKTVHSLALFTRPQHLIRTYHSLDKDLVPEFSPSRSNGCLLSGALSGAYPLRERLVQNLSKLPETDYLRHPGYHMKGCQTPKFLEMLSTFKVAICTSSRYKYALRKIMEATACGCVVITDLEETLPKIDGNLVRVPSDVTTGDVGVLIEHLIRTYDPIRQLWFAEEAKTYYDYRVVGQRLANDIETMRSNYGR